MLGTVGFLVAAAAVGAFAYSVSRAYPEVESSRRRAFSMGFYLLALDFLLWALVAFVARPTFTHGLMIASDAVLVVATGYMLYVSLADSWRPQLVIPTVATGSILLGLRSAVYVPEAYVQSGLLYFNLQSGGRAIILGALFLIWLPAVYALTRRINLGPGAPNMQQALSVIFLTLLLMTAFFLSTRRPVMIIVSFVGIVLLFAMATAVNILLIKVRELGRMPRGTRSAATK